MNHSLFIFRWVMPSCVVSYGLVCPRFFDARPVTQSTITLIVSSDAFDCKCGQHEDSPLGLHEEIKGGYSQDAQHKH